MVDMSLRPATELDDVTALLDIGSAKVACALLAPDGHVLALGLTASSGVNGGLVVDPRVVHAVVAKAIVDAERSAGLRASSAILAVNGGALALQSLAADVQLDPPVVTAEVVTRLQQSLSQHAQRHERAVIHLSRPRFRLDDRAHALPPIDRFGRLLAIEQTVMTVDLQPLVRLVATVEATGLAVSRIVPAGIATALAVTSPQERTAAIAVVDIGAAATAITVFARGRPTLATTIAIGKNQIDADPPGLHMDLINQGRITATYGTSRVAHVDIADYGDADDFSPSSTDLSSAMLGSTRDVRAPTNDIGRLERLLRLIADRLDGPSVGLDALSPVVLTGGGCRIPNLPSVAEWLWARPVRLGWPSDPAMAAPEWSCLAGLATAVREDFGVERPTSRAGARQVA
jgi:cell division protein FtsA